MARWQPIDFMFLGYSLMWGAMVLYMINLQRRQAVVQRDLAALEAAVDQGSPPDTGGRPVELSPTAGGGSRIPH